MAATEYSRLELLVRSALACSHYRVLLGLYEHRPPALDHSRDEVIDALEALAVHCRVTGKDARLSPLYESFGRFAHFYESKYEQWRPVRCDELTPRVIFDAADNGNKLLWGDWTIRCSRPQELTDSYGLPSWGRKVTAVHANGSTHTFEYPDRPCHQAREIFKELTGGYFVGDDGLGDDHQHIYERGYEFE